MSTTPGKNFEGQVGFPTPNTPPDQLACRTFQVPDRDDWLGLLMGAVQLLMSEYNFYQWGDLTPIEAADAWLAIVAQTYDNVPTPCAAPTDTPFWDDSSGDDSDDESPADSQPWYGVWDGESFVEAVSYWAVTAFLATGITEGAAIQFISPLRAFRLTLKGNPHGAKLLAFMDGNLFQTIDLFRASDQVIEVAIVSPGSTLMLVHSGEHNTDATPDSNGNYLAQVIKSRLAESDVLPPNIRYNTTTTPVFQVTNDGGTSWVDSPATDPRYNPAGLLPPLTHYSGIECDVAARMTAQLKATLDNFIAAIDVAQFASDVLALISLPFGWVGWLLDAALFVGNQLIDIGQANIESAFTTTIYHDIQCVFSCYISPDGSITQDALDAAYAQIQSDHPGTVAGVIGELRLLYGDVAMSNAGVSRDETGDCSGCPTCGWVVEYDFTQGNVEGWRAYIDSSYGYGSFNGSMFVGVHTGAPVELFIYLLQAGLHITGISAYAELFHGTGLGHTLYVMNLTSTTPTWSVHASGGIPTNTPPSWIALNTDMWTLTSGLGLYFICDSNGTGYVRVQKIRISGTGTPPPGVKRVNSLT